MRKLFIFTLNQQCYLLTWSVSTVISQGRSIQISLNFKYLSFVNIINFTLDKHFSAKYSRYVVWFFVIRDKNISTRDERISYSQVHHKLYNSSFCVFYFSINISYYSYSLGSFHLLFCSEKKLFAFLMF